MEVLPVRWGCCMKKWWVHRVDILHWFKGKQPSLVGSFKYALEAYDCDDDHSWHAYFPGAQPSSEICIPHSSHKKSEKRLKQLKLGLQWFTDETLDLIKSIGLKQIERHIETSENSDGTKGIAQCGWAQAMVFLAVLKRTWIFGYHVGRELVIYYLGLTGISSSCCFSWRAPKTAIFRGWITCCYLMGPEIFLGLIDLQKAIHPSIASYQNTVLCSKDRDFAKIHLQMASYISVSCCSSHVLCQKVKFLCWLWGFP